MSAVAVKSMTVEEFEALGADMDDFELIDGELTEVEGMGLRHGAITGDLSIDLGLFVRQRRLGRVFSSDTKFVLVATNPPTILGPGISFVRADRLPPGDLPEGIGHFAPDLVVETVSPSDRPSKIKRKIARYLDGGVRLIWLLRPEERTITVVRPNEPDLVLREGDFLDGGEIVPGFRISVSAVSSGGADGRR